MRLESFRILNCFGFVGSGEIELGEPGHLVYFLGRNSSGKTSVLRAISHLEYGEVPAQHPNFVKYETSTEPSLLRARFSVDPSGRRRLSVETLGNGVIQRFSNTPLQIRRGEDGILGYTYLAGDWQSRWAPRPHPRGVLGSHRADL